MGYLHSERGLLAQIVPSLKV